MIAKLQSPLFASLFGLALSVATGVYLSVRALGPLLAKAAVVAEKEAPEELRHRGWDFWTIEIDNLSNELKEERAKLRKQTELVDQRAARVTAEEKELAKVRTDIERLRREIADKVVEITADEAKNIRTLAQTYTNLTPRAAVAIFRELDDNTAVKILSLMKAETVGAIFEEMAKTAGAEGPLARRAALLSERLRLMKVSKPTGQT
jgi:flagellar motility protein MotE (MotC chaperone)